MCIHTIIHNNFVAEIGLDFICEGALLNAQPAAPFIRFTFNYSFLIQHLFFFAFFFASSFEYITIKQICKSMHSAESCERFDPNRLRGWPAYGCLAKSMPLHQNEYSFNIRCSLHQQKNTHKNRQNRQPRQCRWCSSIRLQFLFFLFRKTFFRRSFISFCFYHFNRFHPKLIQMI